MLISSQRYLDESIVESKTDYEVLVSPEFEFDGLTLQVVLDGHHSLSAAKLAGVDPVITVADASDHDAVALLDRGEIEDFLEATRIDSDYYNVDTGLDVW